MNIVQMFNENMKEITSHSSGKLLGEYSQKLAELDRDNDKKEIEKIHLYIKHSGAYPEVRDAAIEAMRNESYNDYARVLEDYEKALSENNNSLTEVLTKGKSDQEIMQAYDFVREDVSNKIKAEVNMAILDRCEPHEIPRNSSDMPYMKENDKLPETLIEWRINADYPGFLEIVQQAEQNLAQQAPAINGASDYAKAIENLSEISYGKQQESIQELDEEKQWYEDINNRVINDDTVDFFIDDYLSTKKVIAQNYVTALLNEEANMQKVCDEKTDELAKHLNNQPSILNNIVTFGQAKAQWKESAIELQDSIQKMEQTIAEKKELIQDGPDGPAAQQYVEECVKPEFRETYAAALKYKQAQRLESTKERIASKEKEREPVAQTR